MDVKGSSNKMIATQQEMVKNKVLIPYRDQCTHLQIPLNKSHQSEFYLLWKCEEERLVYEECEYELVTERMLKMQKIREEEVELKQAKKQGLPPSRIQLMPRPEAQLLWLVLLYLGFYHRERGKPKYSRSLVGALMESC